MPGLSPAVFDALVAAHTEKLCRFVFRYVGSRDEAEDIVQEVFVAIWEHGHAFQAADALPYLYKAALNRVVSRKRHHVVRERFAADFGAADGPRHEDTDERAAESELAQAVARGIEALPARCRLVFIMSREQGLSHAQIATALGLSVKTVESHIWRALTSLRASLAPFLG
jgi:RNA polymerase sigma-70 factor (ECF subfamily)